MLNPGIRSEVATRTIACRLIGKRDFAHFLIFKMSAKGAKVQRLTFDKWAVSDVLGHKTVIESGLEYVYFVWCKVCAPQSGNGSVDLWPSGLRCRTQVQWS